MGDDRNSNDMPRPRSWGRRILTVLGMAFVVWLVFQLWPVWTEPGTKTTVITGPLRPDGTIDYAAALNDECSAGVTPENNAVVLLIQALGPNIIDPPVRAVYFQRLGINEPPPDGRFLQSLEQMLAGDQETLQRVTEEMDQACKKPWSEADHPELARWLTINEEPLKLCAEACRREKFFDPIVPPTGGTMLDGLFPLVQNSRSISRLIGLRVTHHLQAGRVNEALADIETMHRLSRLIGQHPMVIPQLTAVGLQAMASSADSAIVQSGLVSAEQARRQREMLRKLPPFPAMAHIIDHGERFLAMDTLQTNVLGQMRWMFLDGNLILTRMNVGIDDAVAAMKFEDIKAQREAFDAIEEQINLRVKKKLTIVRVLAGRRYAVSSQIADVMFALVVPAYKTNAVSERRRQIREDLVLVGYVLAEYHATEGTFPQSLEDLVPKYLTQVPRDPYIDGPVRYVVDPEGGTILLYSFGENGVDDGGRIDGATKQDDIGFGAVPEK